MSTDRTYFDHVIACDPFRATLVVMKKNIQRCLSEQQP